MKEISNTSYSKIELNFVPQVTNMIELEISIAGYDGATITITDVFVEITSGE